MKAYILFLAILLGFTSCEKEVLLPSQELSSKVPAKAPVGPSVSAWNTFVITDAKMIMDTELGEHIIYDHFDTTKSRSCLRLESSGTGYDIDYIVKDTTTWTFTEPTDPHQQYGKLIINNDPTNYYTVNYVGGYTTVIDYHSPSVIGVTRPYMGITTDYSKGEIQIRIYFAEGSLNGVNCSYFTQLTLRKV